MVVPLVMCSRQLIGSHSALRLAELEQTTVGLHQVTLVVTMVMTYNFVEVYNCGTLVLGEVTAITNWASELV